MRSATVRLIVTDRDGDVHDVDAACGDTLMETLREYEWGVAAVCGGMISCGTCHVYLAADAAGRFAPPSPDEQDLLEMLEFGRGGSSRLSCQLIVSEDHDGLALELAPDE